MQKITTGFSAALENIEYPDIWEALYTVAYKYC